MLGFLQSSRIGVSIMTPLSHKTRTTWFATDQRRMWLKFSNCDEHSAECDFDAELVCSDKYVPAAPQTSSPPLAFAAANRHLMACIGHGSVNHTLFVIRWGLVQDGHGPFVDICADAVLKKFPVHLRFCPGRCFSRRCAKPMNQQLRKTRPKSF